MGAISGGQRVEERNSDARQLWPGNPVANARNGGIWHHAVGAAKRGEGWPAAGYRFCLWRRLVWVACIQDLLDLLRGFLGGGLYLGDLLRCQLIFLLGLLILVSLVEDGAVGRAIPADQLEIKIRCGV